MKGRHKNLEHRCSGAWIWGGQIFKVTFVLIHTLDVIHKKHQISQTFVKQCAVNIQGNCIQMKFNYWIIIRRIKQKFRQAGNLQQEETKDLYTQCMYKLCLELQEEMGFIYYMMFYTQTVVDSPVPLKFPQTSPYYLSDILIYHISL